MKTPVASAKTAHKEGKHRPQPWHNEALSKHRVPAKFWNSSLGCVILERRTGYPRWKMPMLLR
jgi:hypothetical protein